MTLEVVLFVCFCGPDKYTISIQRPPSICSDVEECLEFVWKATESDNYEINDGIRKRARESRELHMTRFLMDDTRADVCRVSE